MADIFISQADGDEEAGETCAEVLRRLGYTVTGPADMPGTGPADAWLQREIDRAACVLVLWSSRSVSCRQVIADAERALIDRKYVPAFLERVSVSAHPVGLPLTGAPVLAGWAGAPTDPPWRKILKAIRSHCQHGKLV